MVAGAVAVTRLEAWAWTVLGRIHGPTTATWLQRCCEEARSREPVTEADRRRHAELVGQQRERDEARRANG